ncbi:MAG: M48 family metalloprotease [Alphaproteobacteria bacterium]
MVVIKSFVNLFIVLLFLITEEVNSSQIIDYETEEFIYELTDEIKIANNIDKNFNIKIIQDENINAFVDQNNIIYITSALIENCDDYIALLSVIAHEIGHIDNNHIDKRILKRNNLNNINTLTNLSLIASSLLFNNPEVIKGVFLSGGRLTENNINFSKDQEREADYYSLETLKKLNLYSNSIINLLLQIEKKFLEKGFAKENLKYSTHPYFEERVDVINYLNNNKGTNLDEDLNLKFKFIQAKFIGYRGDITNINNLKDPFKIYANAILDAKKGNLKDSLRNLNKLILTNKNNFFLVETKADILFSYGYTNESIKFYNKVVNEYPNNNYAQIRIFENTSIENLTNKEIEILFIKNLNLLNKYYNNKNLLQKYLELSEYTGKTDWKEFIYYWLNKNKDPEGIKKKLNKYIKTNDKHLFDLIQLIYNNYQ